MCRQTARPTPMRRSIHVVELEVAPRTRIDLSRLPLTMWISSNWRHVTGAVCPDSVRWACPVRTTWILMNVAPAFADTALTVPHPYSSITAPADEPIPPELHSANKVLIHVPASICVRGCGHHKRASRRSAPREQMGVKRASRDRHGWMRNCPEDVHRHHTLTSCEVPLSQRLV
jgi:hypothetical protein